MARETLGLSEKELPSIFFGRGKHVGIRWRRRVLGGVEFGAEWIDLLGSFVSGDGLRGHGIHRVLGVGLEDPGSKNLAEKFGIWALAELLHDERRIASRVRRIWSHRDVGHLI